MRLWLTIVLLTSQGLYANDFLDLADLNSVNIFNQKIKKEPRTEDLAQFRFALTLTPREPIVIVDSNGVKRRKMADLNPIQKILKARLGKINHFYINGYHVETIPVSWNAQHKIYKTKLNLYKRLGEYQEVEEYLTSLTFDGAMVGSEKIYNFDTFATKNVSDKEGNIILKVDVGMPAAIDKIASK